MSKHFLTTGEAASMLGISRSTVSRRFDAGALRGKVNPVTGERMISRQSVAEFIAQHDLPIDVGRFSAKRLLMGPVPQSLATAVRDIVRADDRIALNDVARGAEALVASVKERPDVLVVATGFPDIGAESVIDALRKEAGHRRLRVLACVPPDRIDDFLSAGVDVILPDDAIEGTPLKQILYNLMDLPPVEPERAESGMHQRRWPRHETHLPAAIAVYPIRNPKQVNTGRALLQNISQGGALLTRLAFDKNTLPAEPFRMTVNIDAPPLKGWHAECQVVRLRCNGALSAGVRFIDISEGDRKRIRALRSH